MDFNGLSQIPDPLFRPGLSNPFITERKKAENRMRMPFFSLISLKYFLFMGLERRKKEDSTGKASKNISWKEALEKKSGKTEEEEIKREDPENPGPAAEVKEEPTDTDKDESAAP
ncbi:MAG: hypothetical protein ACHQRM_10260 [Bacteroidia bacterium]